MSGETVLNYVLIAFIGGLITGVVISRPRFRGF